MSVDLIVQYCSMIRATVTQVEVSLQMIGSQVSALESYARQQSEQGRAVLSLPERCLDYKEEDCGRQSEEAILESGGMGGSDIQRMCRGCGRNPSDP